MTTTGPAGLRSTSGLPTLPVSRSPYATYWARTRGQNSSAEVAQSRTRRGLVLIEREIAFRANFMINGLQAIVTTGAGLIMIGVVYRQTDDLGGWRIGEALVLLGTFQIVSGVLVTFIEPSLQWFANGIKTGQLDEKLLKPIASLFLASLGTHAPFGLVQAILGAGLVIAWHHETGNALVTWNIVGYLAMLTSGVALT